MDELATIDLPSMLDYVTEKTNARGNILYIGHSLGTTMGMMYASAFPDKAKETVKLFLFMAPAHKLKNMVSPLRGAQPFADTIKVDFEYIFFNSI